jgi:hypothetical protein
VDSAPVAGAFGPSAKAASILGHPITFASPSAPIRAGAEHGIGEFRRFSRASLGRL